MIPAHFGEPLDFVFSLLLGLILGSFFNVCIVRLPRDDEKVTKGRSRCPNCGQAIAWRHNIPVLSFLWLRGRCASCQSAISLQYPVVELLSAALFVWLQHVFGWGVEFLGYAVFFSTLLIISVIDLYHRIIPDELSLGGIVVGFGFSFLMPDVTWFESLLGILLGGGVFLLIALFYEKLSGREGLGGGDIKLLGMIGAWLGIKSVVLIIMISSALGSVIGVIWMLIRKGDLKSAIPFGPFLAVAAFIFVFFRDTLMQMLYPPIP